MKKVYRIISMILTTAMIYSSISAMATSNDVTQTEEVLETSIQTLAEPTSNKIPEGYIAVSNVDDLKAIDKDAESRGKKYYLTNDIDMSGVENFDPIGDMSIVKDFDGMFDGGGHVIYNLNVNTGDGDYAGLFGCVGSGGTVKNLGVEGKVKGNNYVGGLVGWLSDNATLENCYFTGGVKGSKNVGGLVGQCGDAGLFGGSSDILKSYFIGTITGKENVGGIVGKLVCASEKNVAEIKYCYSVCKFISAENGATIADCGNIVGYCYAYSVKNLHDFAKCYYTDKDFEAIGKMHRKIFYSEDVYHIDVKNFSGPGVAEKYGLSGYISAPQQISANGQRYYYPQLECFVTNKNDLSQFPYTMPYTVSLQPAEA